MSVTEPIAEASRAVHPNRFGFAMFSDRNPFMTPVKELAQSVRSSRQPVSADNPLLAMEQAASTWITTCLQSWGELRDSMTEAVFLNTYGSPWLQALVGLGIPQTAPHRIERDLIREADVARLRAELEKQFEVGGVPEAAMRALIYIRMPEGSIDERGFSVLKLIRASHPAEKQMSLAHFKEMVRQQYLLVCMDQERAIGSLSILLGKDAGPRKTALEMLHRVLAARGEMSDEGKRRLKRIEAMFAADTTKRSKSEAEHA
jgi:hypothetical protein